MSPRVAVWIGLRAIRTAVLFWDAANGIEAAKSRTKSGPDVIVRRRGNSRRDSASYWLNKRF
jgi:hypothetical protein